MTYSFITINPRSTLAQNGSTCPGPIYMSYRSVWKLLVYKWGGNPHTPDLKNLSLTIRCSLVSYPGHHFWRGERILSLIIRVPWLKSLISSCSSNRLRSILPIWFNVLFINSRPLKISKYQSDLLYILVSCSKKGKWYSHCLVLSGRNLYPLPTIYQVTLALRWLRQVCDIFFFLNIKSIVYFSL